MMKVRHPLPLSLLASQASHGALTVEWGSLIPCILVDNSKGEVLDDSDAFQLGVFVSLPADEPLIPTGNNISDRADNWVVFGQATYNEELGYFTGSAGINGDGTSTSGFADKDLGLNFAGRQAYVWAFNSKNPTPGTEWFLATSTTWTFSRRATTNAVILLQTSVGRSATLKTPPLCGVPRQAMLVQAITRSPILRTTFRRLPCRNHRRS